MRKVVSIQFVPFIQDIETETFDRYIVVDTYNDWFQFDYVHEECVVATSNYFGEMEIVYG